MLVHLRVPGGERGRGERPRPRPALLKQISLSQRRAPRFSACERNPFRREPFFQPSNERGETGIKSVEVTIPDVNFGTESGSVYSPFPLFERLHEGRSSLSRHADPSDVWLATPLRLLVRTKTPAAQQNPVPPFTVRTHFGSAR